MDDAAIVALFWARDERAIPATAEKYGSYCTAVARNILRDQRDAEECVSDTYLRAWSAMPPHRPAMLAVFLGRITRNLALNRLRSAAPLLRSAAAQKRGGGGAEAVFEELQHIVSDRDTPEIALDRRELVAAINDFLAALPETKRRIFVCRYWYFDSVPDIAKRFSLSENHVYVTLHRLRTQLRRRLSERGFML